MGPHHCGGRCDGLSNPPLCFYLYSFQASSRPSAGWLHLERVELEDKNGAAILASVSLFCSGRMGNLGPYLALSAIDFVHWRLYNSYFAPSDGHAGATAGFDTSGSSSGNARCAHHGTSVPAFKRECETTL